MEPVIIEILKLRRSASWGVVLVLPVASVLSACVIVRPTDWQLLWIRSVGFYGMALLPVSLAVLASLVWRVDHQGSNWNALMSSSVPTWRTVAAKAIGSAYRRGLCAGVRPPDGPVSLHSFLRPARCGRSGTDGSWYHDAARARPGGLVAAPSTGDQDDADRGGR